MSQTLPTLDGLWQLTHATHEGEQAPELVIERTTLAIHSTTYEIRFADQVADCGALARDPAQADTLVLTSATGAHSGRVVPCIFQRKGDLLRICYGFDGARPTAFTAPANSGRYLATYRKA